MSLICVNYVNEDWIDLNFYFELKEATLNQILSDNNIKENLKCWKSMDILL